MQTRKFTTLYILSLLLFGSNGIIASGIVLTPQLLVLIRCALGAITLLVALALFRRNRFKLIFSNKKDALYLLLSGASLGVSWMFLFSAYKLIGVGVSTLAYYLGPVIVMLASPYLFHEKLTAQKLFSFTLVLMGCALVVASPGSSLNLLGLLFGAGSALGYASMVYFARKVRVISGVAASTTTLIGAFVATLIATLLPLLWDAEGVRAQFFALIHLSTNNVGQILALGLINTGMGCLLYFATIGKLAVQRVAVFGYLEPLSAVVMSMLILHEPATFARLIGAVLIIGGALVSEVALPKLASTITRLKGQLS